MSDFSIPVPIPRLGMSEFRFWDRFRDLKCLSFDSGSNSETWNVWVSVPRPILRLFQAWISIPNPILRRDLNRESRCFGSETREPGISGAFIGNAVVFIDSNIWGSPWPSHFRLLYTVSENIILWYSNVLKYKPKPIPFHCCSVCVCCTAHLLPPLSHWTFSMQN